MADEKKEETVTATFAFNITVATDNIATKKVVYMVVTGIPHDLPVEMHSTIEMTAKQQFVSTLSQRAFLEVYDPGHDVHDSQPMFINLNNVTAIKIDSVEQIK